MRTESVFILTQWRAKQALIKAWTDAAGLHFRWLTVTGNIQNLQRLQTHFCRNPIHIQFMSTLAFHSQTNSKLRIRLEPFHRRFISEGSANECRQNCVCNQSEEQSMRVARWPVILLHPAIFIVQNSSPSALIRSLPKACRTPDRCLGQVRMVLILPTTSWMDSTLDSYVKKIHSQSELGGCLCQTMSTFEGGPIAVWQY